MIRKFLLPALLLTVIGSVKAQEAWDLQKCINYAIEHNLQMVQQQLNENMAGNNLLQSRLNLLPTLNASTSTGVTAGRSINPTSGTFNTQTLTSSTYNATTGLTIFSGLQKIRTIQQNKLIAQANHFQTSSTKDTIALMVTQAFLAVMTNREQVKAALEQVDISQKQQEQTRQQYEAGVVPEGTLLHAESQLANDSVALITAQNAIELSLVNLALMMPVEPAGFDIKAPEIGEKVPPMEPIGAEGIYDYAAKNQPFVKSADLSTRSVQKALGVAKGAQSPVFSLFGQMYTNYSSEASLSIDPKTLKFTSILDPYFTQIRHNLAEVGGISINIPIFNGWQVRNSISNAKVRYLQQKAIFDGVKIKLKQDVYRAYTDAKGAAQKYSALVKNVQSLKKTFEYAQSMFDLGASNAVDYTTAKSNLAIAEENMINAKFDYIFKLKVLDFYQGKPITLDQQ